MRRQKGSLIATEVEETDTPIPTTFFTVLENENRQGYSRLLLADYGDVSNHSVRLFDYKIVAHLNFGLV